ncbi:unnamed protein product [Ectocarpus sp. 12 AP-2014]
MGGLHDFKMACRVSMSPMYEFWTCRGRFHWTAVGNASISRQGNACGLDSRVANALLQTHNCWSSFSSIILEGMGLASVRPVVEGQWKAKWPRNWELTTTTNKSSKCFNQRNACNGEQRAFAESQGQQQQGVA